MSKAIMISIKPKWVVKILNGEKTIEIRKTCPKCDLPIDVYIYCTKIKEASYVANKEGKVVAKFTLNRVEEILSAKTIGVPICFTKSLLEKDLCIATCLTPYDFDNYLGDKLGYAWHISNLEIFDKPKELSEFRKIGKQCKYQGRDSYCDYCSHCDCIGDELTKAPQSWGYVEELL